MIYVLYIIILLVILLYYIISYIIIEFASEFSSVWWLEDLHTSSVPPWELQCEAESRSE